MGIKNCQEQKGERRAPKGHFVVYVGKEDQLKRYIIPLSHLKRPSFQQLLLEAEKEYGFHGQKSIVLPCDENTFLLAIDDHHSS